MTTGLLIPADAWPVHGLLFSLVIVGHSLSGIPFHYLYQRLLGFWAFAFLLTIGIPAGEGFRGGWDLAANILIHSSLAFITGLWLVNVTPFDRLLWTLKRWGMPSLFVAILSFMYRYSFVVFDELQRMRIARKARHFGQGSWWEDWKSTSHLVGMLIVRSLTRAERIHGAMCARGWTGDVHVLDDLPQGRNTGTSSQNQ